MLSDYWMTGIGVGEAAFTQIYPLYSYIGIESTVHSHNIFLQIAIELGAAALIIFVFLMFLVIQKGFWSLKNTSDAWIKLFTSAAISGLVAALIHGMVDYIWYNCRVFFVFWVVVALVCISMEVCRKEKLKNNGQVYTMRERSVSLDIIF
jgi:O-antigen ligase